MLGSHRRRNLTKTPDIRPENPARDFTVRSPVDRLGLLVCGASTALDFPKDCRSYSAFLGEVIQWPGESDLRWMHRRTPIPSLDVSSHFVKRQNPFENSKGDQSNALMTNKKTSEWIQQPRFRELADQWEANGVTKEDQAKGIGIEYSSFSTWYSGKREPGKKTIRLMCAYYGVPLAELTDDPGGTIPGVDADEWAKMTPAKRLVLRSIAQKLGPEDVTDESAEKMWRAIDSLIEAGKIKPSR